MRASALFANATALSLQAIDSEFGIFGNGKECFPWVLFDKQTYPAAGFVAPVQFFQRQQGQGGIGADITNMPGQGLFPQNVQYVADSLEYDFIPARDVGRVVADTDAAGAEPSNFSDKYNVCMNGYVEITLANVKNYGKISPLAQLVPSYRIGGVAALAVNNGFQAVAADKTPHGLEIDAPAIMGASFPVGPFFIPSTTSFQVNLSFPSGAIPVQADSVHMFNLNGLYIQRRM